MILGKKCTKFCFLVKLNQSYLWQILRYTIDIHPIKPSDVAACHCVSNHGNPRLFHESFELFHKSSTFFCMILIKSLVFILKLHRCYSMTPRFLCVCVLFKWTETKKPVIVFLCTCSCLILNLTLYYISWLNLYLSHLCLYLKPSWGLFDVTICRQRLITIMYHLAENCFVFQTTWNGKLEINTKEDEVIANEPERVREGGGVGYYP